MHFVALLYPSNVFTNIYMKRFMDDKFLGLGQIQRGISVEDVSEIIYTSYYRVCQGFLTEAQESSSICQILRLLLGT